MKKLFTLICLLVLAASTSWAQQLYTEFVEATGTLTYYYDDQMSSRSGVKEVYDQSKGLSISYESDVHKAVIDPSMKDAPLYSTYCMFHFLVNMVRIEGLANLNTANVKDMSSMFYDCSALTSLNLSSFNTAKVTNMASMFSYCKSLTSLNLSSFNTAKVTNMASMFSYCESLTSLNLSSFNTANVEDMEDMFYGCSSLTSLNLSSFNTAQVWSMNEMFCDCSSLTSLNLSSFNTANVKNMEGMFSYCSFLTSLDLSSFNTAMVTNMSKMFYRCISLTSLDLISFNTDRVTNMSNMFYFCNALTSLDLISFNTAKVTDMSEMFKYCYNLTTIFCDDDWSTSSVLASSNDMFYNCNALVGGKGTKYESYHITNETYARPDGGTSKPGYFTGGVPEYGIFVASSNPTTGLEYDFINATEFVFDDELAAYVATVGTEGNPASWVNRVMISNVRGRENRFKAATVMTSGMINGTEHTWLNYTETPNAEILLPAAGVWRIALDDYNRKINFYQIEGDEIRVVYTEFDEATGTLTYYYDANRETRTGITELYTPEDHDALRFKDYYKKVTKAVIDPSMKNAHLTSTYSMFYGGVSQDPSGIYALENMTKIEGLENLSTSTVTDMESMFFGCYALTSLDLSSFNTSAVTNMNGMFSMCLALTQLDLSSFNTSNVMDFNGMFMFCNKLKMIDVSSFDISKATKMDYMFSYCGELTTIYCDKDWSSTSASSEYMFSTSRKLVGGKGTAYDSHVLDATYARPDGGTESPGYFTAGVVGDVNGDKVVNFTDAQSILTLMANENYDSSADVNNDDAVNFTDYQSILTIMAQ